MWYELQTLTRTSHQSMAKLLMDGCCAAHRLCGGQGIGGKHFDIGMYWSRRRKPVVKDLGAFTDMLDISSA
jgi:hypothetical protein